MLSPRSLAKPCAQRTVYAAKPAVFIVQGRVQDAGRRIGASRERAAAASLKKDLGLRELRPKTTDVGVNRKAVTFGADTAKHEQKYHCNQHRDLFKRAPDTYVARWQASMAGSH